MSAEPDRVAADLVEHEGFRGEAYRDSLGFWTIGYGTRLPLTRAEAYLLLRHRMCEKADELDRAQPWWRDLPTPAANALLNMAYQLGVPGLLGFAKTLALLRDGRYAAAADEALNSKWARHDTPARAAKVAAMIRSAEE